jgi:putative ABC transport system permease protein
LETRGFDLVVSPERAANRAAASIPQSIAPQLQELPGVRVVEPMLVDLISFPDQDLMAVYILGLDVNGSMFRNWKFTSGRAPLPTDEKPAVLGGVLAANLGKSVGDTVNIIDHDFKIVGIFEAKNIFENSVGAILLPDLQKMLFRQGRVNAFAIGVEATSDKGKLLEQLITSIGQFKDEQGKRIPLAVRTTQDHIQSTLELKVVKGMAWATSFIALFIGVIGMLNIMMISVFERTREIGTIRAVGWTKWRVIAMILLESMVLAGFGSLAGVAMSYGLIWLLGTFPSVSALILPTTVNFSIVLRACLLALACGLLGALYPAWFASRLLPSEALRHE